jgi:hypothetical protein
MLSKTKIQRGETFQGTILLKNIGDDAAVIPWSSDARLGNRPSNAVEHEYEQGWFDVELIAPKTRVPLESESRSFPLYGSRSAPVSRLRIAPGQSIVAKFSFVVEGKKTLSASLPIQAGAAAIKAEWRQVRYTWRRNGCEVNIGYFNHRYREDQNAVDVNILH